MRRREGRHAGLIVGLNMGEMQNKLLHIHSCCSNEAARSYSALRSPTQQISLCSRGFLEKSAEKGAPVARETLSVPLACLLTRRCVP